MTNHPPTILAIDPGLRELGYAVLRGDDLLDHGVLPLRHLPARRRLRRVRAALETWLRGYRPDSLAVERMPRRPLDSTTGLPALRRLVRRFASRHALPLHAYSARSVRQHVVGNGWAGKREAARALSREFPQLRVYRTQDRKWKESYWQNMYDAVGLARHHQLVTQPPSRSR